MNNDNATTRALRTCSGRTLCASPGLAITTPRRCVCVVMEGVTETLPRPGGLRGRQGEQGEQLRKFVGATHFRSTEFDVQNKIGIIPNSTNGTESLANSTATRILGVIEEKTETDAACFMCSFLKVMNGEAPSKRRRRSSKLSGGSEDWPEEWSQSGGSRLNGDKVLQTNMIPLLIYLVLREMNYSK